jgi:hypothetical protein
VEHGDKADIGAEMTPVGGDRAQRLGRRLEQDGVDRGLVLEGNFGRRRRQREDDMEIGHRQQFGLPRGQPCHARGRLAFRAMAVAAGIIGDANQAAFRAPLDMAAEPRRAACLDRRHDAALGAAEVAGMRLAISLAVAAEDVRHLQCRHDSRGSSQAGFPQFQPVERARRVADRRGRDLRVTGRG